MCAARGVTWLWSVSLRLWGGGVRPGGRGPEVEGWRPAETQARANQAFSQTEKSSPRGGEKAAGGHPVSRAQNQGCRSYEASSQPRGSFFLTNSHQMCVSVSEQERQGWGEGRQAGGAGF